MDKFHLLDENDSRLNSILSHSHRSVYANNFNHSYSKHSFSINDVDEDEIDDITYKQAAIDITSNAVFSILAILWEFAIVPINQIFIGHLNDPNKLAGLGLAQFTINVICFAPALGFNGSIETLVSQAYGDKEFYLWGCYLNRGRILQTLIYLCQFAILFNTKSLLMMMGQIESTSQIAQDFIYLVMPGVFAWAQFDTLRRFLQAMGVFHIQMLILWVTMALHILNCYILVIHYDMGLTGAGIATWITFWLDLILLTGYIHYNRLTIPAQSWHFFNKDSFKDLIHSLKVGIPSALMGIMDWIAFELLGVFSGWISVLAQATCIVFLSMLGVFFMFPLGLSFSVGTLVGNSLGQGKPRKAKKYSITSIVLALTLSLLLIIVFLLNRNNIGHIYTQDADLVDSITEMVPIFSLVILFDSFMGVLTGTIRGCGLQHYGTIVSLVSYIFIMIPSCYSLAFIADLKLKGLWLGAPLGGFFSGLCFVILIWRMDWKKLSDSIADRIATNKVELKMLD